MRGVTFDFSDMHLHGSAFYDFLKLRKKRFVDDLGWNLSHNGVVEMDQYDTPLAHYSVVLRDGCVVGGARTMSTTASWGGHTYMIRDALAGKLADIPPGIIDREISSPDVWECTRLVIDDALTSHADRSQCLALIVDGLVSVARREGAHELVSLSPVSLLRALRQLGYAATRVGGAYANGSDGRRYAVLTMPAGRGDAPPLSSVFAQFLSQ
jgi:N-acyl-L-homoserine lactone synthetase